MVKRQSTFVDAGAVLSATLTYPVPVAAQSLLLCAVRVSSTSPPTSVTDSLGQTFTQDATIGQTTDSHNVTLFSLANTLAGTDTVTVTLASSVSLRIVILEYAGMALSAVLDGTTGAQGDAVTSIPTGNIATTQADELLICLFGNSAPASILADAAFTQEEVVVPGANAGRFMVSDELVHNVGVYHATTTQNVVGNCSTLLASYRGLVTISNVLTGWGSKVVGYYES